MTIDRARLAAVVEAFSSGPEAQACSTPEGAYANCLAVSARFTERLRGEGLPARLQHLEGARRAPAEGASGRWPICDPTDFGHWVAVVDDVVVDWTARQFDPRAAVPAVRPLAEVELEWERSEVWACEHCERLVDDAAHAELTPPGLHAEHVQVGRATSGAGPFPDPRHDRTAPLVRICRCGS